MMEFLLSLEPKLRGLCGRELPMIDPKPIPELLKTFKKCHYCHENFDDYWNEKRGGPTRDHMHCMFFFYSFLCLEKSS